MEIETQTPTQIQTPPPTVVLPPNPPAGGPPPENPSTPTGTSGHRHVTAWVALVIVAAIAATAGYLVWAKAHEAWPYDEVDLSSPSTSLGTASDLAGWKTYRNEEYGFEVRYPQNEIIATEDRHIEFWNKESFEQAVASGGRDIATIFSVQKADLPNKIDQSWVSKTLGLFVLEDNQTTIDGRSAYVARGDEIVGYLKALIIPREKYVLIIMYSVHHESGRKILSTFKFIELVDTTEWKTYKNQTLGIEFNYPQEWGDAKFEQRGCQNFDSTGKPITNGEMFRITFSSINTIEFGGNSSDCSEPRGATWTDFQFYSKAEGHTYNYHPTIIFLRTIPFQLPLTIA